MENNGVIIKGNKEGLNALVNIEKFTGFNDMLLVLIEKLSRGKKFYKDSKLSAVKHGFLRTFDKIDKSFINKEKKRKLIYQMIDVYYDAFDNIKTQIDDISIKVKIKNCIYNNDDALECLTKKETRKVKRK